MSSDTTISTEESPHSSRGNVNSPPRGEIKLRKNEMKLRKKQIKVPKNLFVPPWRVSFSSVDNSDFPLSRGSPILKQSTRYTSLW